MNAGIYEMQVRDVMTRGADTVCDTDTIHAAVEKMVNLDLSALPVLNSARQCVGVLTKTDIVKLAGALDAEVETPRNDLAAMFFGVGLDEVMESRVEDVMTTRVLKVGEEESLKAVAEKMLTYEVHHVPVCNARDEVIGMVSTMDLVKAI